MSTPHTQSYAARVQNHTNPTGRAILELLARKRTNLCVSVDLSKKEDLLRVVDAVGPEVALVKTHIDIVEDFDWDLVERLQALAEKHDFMIFEDRKFADIGNTVSLQYSSGVYRIASWSHLTNAHALPGDGIVSGLAKVGLPLQRGLLLLGEMSSAGSLAVGSYTDASLAMARRHRDFVVGFIAQRRLGGSGPEDDFIVMTPGVGLDVKGDGLGQQYRTPEKVVGLGADVIIVGRGIYGGGKDKESILQEAKRYREAGWKAYEKRTGA